MGFALKLASKGREADSDKTGCRLQSLPRRPPRMGRAIRGSGHSCKELAHHGAGFGINSAGRYRRNAVALGAFARRSICCADG